MKQTVVNRVVVEKGEQVFEFHMAVDASLGLAYEAAYEIFVVIAKNIEERNKKAAEDLEKFNEVEVEVEEVKEEQ